MYLNPMDQNACQFHLHLITSNEFEALLLENTKYPPKSTDEGIN